MGMNKIKLTKPMNMNMNKQQVIKRVESMFAPDITVRVNESTNRIESACAKSKLGAEFILKYPLLGTDYDAALSASNGLCFETFDI